MKIAAIPLEVVPADVDANLRAARDMIGRVTPGTDIVVLPETFTTGFVDDEATLRRVAETIDGKTMRQVHSWAQQFHLAIAGSFVARDSDGKFYNRAFFVEPSSDETFYDKHHLFSQSGEHVLYTPGAKTPEVIRYMGWNIMLAVCYDLRFPEWLRNRGDHAPYYDLLLLPAMWPQKRRMAWETLLRARAIENMAYVVGANRAGYAPDEYQVSSTMIIDYHGSTLAQGDGNGPVEATLNLERLHRYREVFPALDDQDPFELA